MKFAHIVAGLLAGLSAGVLFKVVATRDRHVAVDGTRVYVPRHLRGRVIQMPGRA